MTITAAFVLLGVATASAQIDLTPKESFYEVEGGRYPNIAFRNGSENVSYTPPGKWKLSGGGAKLTGQSAGWCDDRGRSDAPALAASG
jgi:hypothetical protein